MRSIRAFLPVALAASALGTAACGVIPTPPEALPENWIPTVTPSPPDDDLVGSVLGFTPGQQSAVRIRNSGCEEFSTGTGFILDENTIVTNRHVVDGFASLEIDTSDGGSLSVASVSTSQVSDIAVITTVESLTPFVALADQDPKPQDFVTVVGFPLGDQMTTTTGTVTMRTEDDLDNADHVFIISAKAEHGSSGSAAYDKDGLVFGVVYAGQDETKFAIIIPVSIVKESLADLQLLSARASCS